jgi:hypothetical protein
MITVALVKGHESTLRRFRQQNGMIAPEAANPAYETRLLRDDQVAVQGRLQGIDPQLLMWALAVRCVREHAPYVGKRVADHTIISLVAVRRISG